MSTNFLKKPGNYDLSFEERRGPFYQIGRVKKNMSAENIEHEGARCLTCDVPQCNTGVDDGAPGCLLGNPVGIINGYIQEADKANKRSQVEGITLEEKAEHQAERELFRKQAYMTLMASNPLEAWTANVCPTGEGLCTTTCVLGTEYGSGHGSVKIPNILYGLVDEAYEKGWVQPPTPRKENGKLISIIGTGPAAAMAAIMMRRKGWAVEMFEKHAQPGGQAAFGIPDKKLPPHMVDREFDNMRKGGIVIHTNTEVSAEGNFFYKIHPKAGQIAATIGRWLGLSVKVPFNEIAKGSDAVLLAPGLYKAKNHGIDGETIPAFDILFRQNYIERKINHPIYVKDKQHLDAHGKHVVVVGGGDTGRDACNTMLDQGAASVTQIYYKSEVEMGGSRKEKKEAIENGVRMQYNTAVKKVVANDIGTYQVHIVRTENYLDHEKERVALREIPGSEDIIETNLPPVIAIGQSPEEYPKVFGIDGLPLNGWGGLNVVDMKGVRLAGQKEDCEKITIPHSDQTSAGLVTILKFEGKDDEVPVYGAGDGMGTGLMLEAMQGGREISKVIDHNEKNRSLFMVNNAAYVLDI